VRFCGVRRGHLLTLKQAARRKKEKSEKSASEGASSHGMISYFRELGFSCRGELPGKPLRRMQRKKRFLLS
jgi:hypothetical protein